MRLKATFLSLLLLVVLFHLPALAARTLPISSTASFTQHPVSAKSLIRSATQAEPLPDLVIRQVVAVTGDDKKLRAHIVNVGNADASGCNLLLFYKKNGQTVKRGTFVAPIAKGKDLWVDVNNDNPLTAAVSSISLRVDDPNRVKESNELNNAYKFK